MEKKKTFVIPAIISIVVVIALYLLLKYLFSTNAAPSFSQYMASSTASSSATSTSSADSTDNTGSTSTLPSQALPDSSYKSIKILAPKGAVNALVADTVEKMEIGLSYRSTMPQNAGMIFTFDNIGIYPFWMRDMGFNLDVIWLAADKKVIYVMRNLSPQSYPNTFQSDSPALYVLELNAGAAQKLGIATGTLLKF